MGDFALPRRAASDPSRWACTAVADCLDVAEAQGVIDCSDCPDAAAQRRDAEVDARTRADALYVTVAELEDRLPPADATSPEDIALFHAVRLLASGNAKAEADGHEARATQARVWAEQHEAPHTHPVFYCAAHEPPGGLR